MSRGIHERSEARVARPMNTMGRTEPSSLSCSRVTPNPSLLASHYQRKGREFLATACQSGKTKTGGIAKSWRVWRTVASLVEVKMNLAPSFKQGRGGS